MSSASRPEQMAVEEVQRLFLRHAGVLRGFILGLLPDHNRAEDVFQEVFLTLNRKAEEFESGTNFLAWARSIARLKVLEACRTSRVAPLLLEPDAMEALIESAPELDDSWAARREALARCIEQLSPRSREIIQLRYSEEFLPPPQIASRLSWTVGAVHVALCRARKFLQECTRRRMALTEN